MKKFGGVGAGAAKSDAKQESLAARAILTAAPSSYSAENDLADIKAEVAKRHDEAVKRLANWIEQLSIAAEEHGIPAGAEHMALNA